MYQECLNWWPARWFCGSRSLPKTSNLTSNPSKRDKQLAQALRPMEVKDLPKVKSLVAFRQPATSLALLFCFFNK